MTTDLPKYALQLTRRQEHALRPPGDPEPWLTLYALPGDLKRTVRRAVDATCQTCSASWTATQWGGAVEHIAGSHTLSTGHAVDLTWTYAARLEAKR